ncbi:MAG TPA: MinD/ParA family protein [Campylobacterales bacterium]|nr:MinD/ParA family protein [Campylobacterales bacterium]
MKTQADKLQRIVDGEVADQEIKTKIIAVTSGKGGVGKSTLSANMANILSKQGYRVAVFDADIGLANLDIIFNVKATKNLLNVLKGECTLSEIVIEVKENLLLIPGESGDEIFDFHNQIILDRFMEEASFLDSLDYLIIDTGAGIGRHIQLFLEEADEVIIITTPDPSAITDAYATIKVTSNINTHVNLILNHVSNEREGNLIFNKIKNVADNNLNSSLELTYLGSLTRDETISKSSKYRVLFTQEYPNSVSTYELNEIIQNLVYKLEHKVLNSQVRKSFAVFVRRLIEKF